MAEKERETRSGIFGDYENTGKQHLEKSAAPSNALLLAKAKSAALPTHPPGQTISDTVSVLKNGTCPIF